MNLLQSIPVFSQQNQAILLYELTSTHAPTNKFQGVPNFKFEDNLTKRTVVLWTPFVLYLDNSLEFGLFDSPVIVDVKDTKDLPGGVEGCKYKTTH